MPATGKELTVEAIDTAALSSRQVLRLERGKIEQATGPRFDDLNPMVGRRVLQNKNALALIVGVSDYSALMHRPYTPTRCSIFSRLRIAKLSIPDQNITTLVNEKAEQEMCFLRSRTE